MENHVAWIDDIYALTVIADNIASWNLTDESPNIYWEAKDKYFAIAVDKVINDSTLRMTLFEELPMGESLVLQWGKEKIPVYPRAVVRTNWFDHNYSALGNKLGANYEASATTFSVWAPTATDVKLCLDHHLFKLERVQNGIWKRKIDGDWHGFAYDYEVTINGSLTYVNDPYAKAMRANSAKSVIIDLSKTDPPQYREQERPELPNLQDAIIYELHVRDATIQEESGVGNKGKFLGLAETATTNTFGLSTALSYIKELGCTHVQLLPINDFARVDELDPKDDYNWGYDPLYFQVPEGSYATSPDDPGARIKECKQMIHAFHREGISIILDVVYNHVFIMESSPFEKLVPGYYFRYHDDGNPSNGTGVGNDFATEREMARQFIIDTIDFWLQEYKVDGFRFDLMGAIDIETMQKIHDLCKVEATPIMLLGEGWELQTALASEKKSTSFNSDQLRGIRFFNDLFRDSIRGNLFNIQDSGFANGQGHFIERMPQLVSGSVLEEFGMNFVSEVNQTVNYVECHDNHTLWDRLLLTNSQDSESDRKKMHQLATGITLLSQGIPFIHAGQEWFRSKQGDENSYISGDQVNQLEWYQRGLETENIAFIKTLIALRKAYVVFRLPSKEEVRRRFHVLDAPNPVFGYALFGNNEDFSIYMNPTKKSYPLRLPSTGQWITMATNDSQKKEGNRKIDGEFTFIEPYELIVLKKAINSRSIYDV